MNQIKVTFAYYLVSIETGRRKPKQILDDMLPPVTARPSLGKL